MRYFPANTGQSKNVKEKLFTPLEILAESVKILTVI